MISKWRGGRWHWGATTWSEPVGWRQNETKTHKERQRETYTHTHINRANKGLGSHWAGPSMGHPIRAY